MIFVFGVTLVEAKQYKFEMTIDEVTIKFAPKLDYKVFAFNGQVPAPLIHVKEGDDVEVFVMNNASIFNIKFPFSIMIFQRGLPTDRNKTKY